MERSNPRQVDAIDVATGVESGRNGMGIVVDVVRNLKPSDAHIARSRLGSIKEIIDLGFVMKFFLITAMNALVVERTNLDSSLSIT